MRFTNFITLGALGVATLVSGTQDINNRNLDAVDGVYPLARDLSAEHLPVEARTKTSSKSAKSTLATSTRSTTSAKSATSTEFATSTKPATSTMFATSTSAAAPY